VENRLTIEQWLDALRGKPQSAEHAMAPDMSVLREIIAASATRHIRPVGSDTRARFHEFLRAQSTTMREGDKQEKGVAPSLSMTVWKRLREWAAPRQGTLKFSALALTALVAVPLVYKSMIQVDENEGAVMRGDVQPIQVFANNPAQRADEIEAVLKRHGVNVYRTTSVRAIVLQAMVRVDDLETRSALASQSIGVPDHGRLNLIIRQR
jgi:hypothetical protein